MRDKELLSPIGRSTGATYYWKDFSRVAQFYDGNKTLDVLSECVRRDGLEVLSKSFDPFDSNGIQGLSARLTLNYSHAELHTSGEYGSVRFELYSCKNAHSGVLAEKSLFEACRPDLAVVDSNLVIVDQDYVLKPEVVGMSEAGIKVIRFGGVEFLYDFSKQVHQEQFRKKLVDAKNSLK